MSTDSRYILASKVAQFLRRNGDKVINGSCKLSLTTSALCLLNSLFIDYLNQDLQIIEFSDSSSYKVVEDVEYLYNFMKKTSSLKLFHRMQTLRGGVDLSHFTNLTVLELRKIPAHLIIGLNDLSAQLKALICSRSIYLLKELFGSSVAEESSTAYFWTELKELNLSYNYLESLDDSIEFLPNIEILDLSHNNLKNVEKIQVLNKLTFVNLSYNQLEILPKFSSLCCRYLNKLYVRYNGLEKLDGLECLFNLEEFDAGYNLLSEYYVLTPLDKLKSLKMLNLEGNPIFFHKQHFQLVSTFIHPFALNRGLHVNGKLLCIPQELNPAASDLEDGHHQISINTIIGDMPNEIHPTYIKRHLGDFSPLISVDSENSLNENSVSSCVSRSGEGEMIEAEIKTEKKQRLKSKRYSKGNIAREAHISEPDEYDCNGIIPSPKDTESVVPGQIKAKLAVEARRKERGESWLIPDTPFQKLLPPKVPSNTPVFNDIYDFEKLQDVLPQKLQTCLESEVSEIIPSPIDKEMTEVLDIKSENVSDSGSERRRHISKESDIEILASNVECSAEADIGILSTEDTSDCEFYEGSGLGYSNINEDDIELDSDEETEDSIFFVERQDDVEKMLSVNIGPNYAKEKDVISGKVLDRLDLSSLSSVKTFTKEQDDIKSYEIHLEFDTIKSSRQKRLYAFQDLESAENMSRILQPFADASTLKKATLGALECLNCKSQFSKEVANRIVIKTKKPLMGKDVVSSSYDSSKGYLQERDVCPNCGNHILVEMESIPLPAVAAPARLTINHVTASKKSSESTPDNISVGSASSGNFFSNFLSSVKISPMLKRKSIAAPLNGSLGDDSSKSTDEMSTYQSEKELSKRRGSESQITRNSSDITIISNPSQSSIAVIPEPVMDSNLNTIVERESQASLSPPVSRGSTVLHNMAAAQNVKDLEGYHLGNDGGNNENICTSPSKDDYDFYSFTESFEEQKEKTTENISQNFKVFKSSDIISSDSDIYHSPYKSVGSSRSETASRVETDESAKLIKILADKKMVTCDSFMQLDHRLKLHIEINIFGNDEHLVACLQNSIVPLTTGDVFDGLFMLSSKNVYVIKFLPQYTLTLEQSESLDKQLQILFCGPLSQIKQIKTILGNQGISVACGPPTHVYTLMIRDVDICNCFCNLISEQILEQNAQFECLTSAKEMLELLYDSVLTPFAESEEKPEILLHQFAFQRENEVMLPVCVTLTQEDIFLSKILYKKQQSCTDLSKMHPYCYTNSEHQKVSDIVSLKLEKDFTGVEICFLIESSDVDSLSWTLEMQTKSALYTFISALKTPWEELFAVSLPLSLTNS